MHGNRPQDFGYHKARLDQLSGVTGWWLHDLRRTLVLGLARLGVPPHVADKILNHQSGTISGVAQVYQRHEFLAERKQALEIWGLHVRTVLTTQSENTKPSRDPGCVKNEPAEVIFGYDSRAI
jgi:hypothetical protein